jgi:hypothetical protein
MSGEATFTCPHHGGTFAKAVGVSCPECEAWFAALPDPATMTPNERLIELEQYIGDRGSRRILTTKFEILHARLEALAGCPLWTHQLVERDWLREVVKRRNGEDNDPGTVIGQLAERVGSDRVVVIEGP